MIRTNFSTVILNRIEVLSKTSYDSNKSFRSHFTLCGGPMCAMIFLLYGWDLRNIAKIDQGMATCELFQFCQRQSTRFERNYLRRFYTLWEPVCAMTSKLYDCDFKNIAKIDQGKVIFELFN